MLSETEVQRSLKKYLSCADILRVVAEQKTSLKIPQQTYQGWYLTFAVLRLADYKVDSLKNNLDRKIFIRDWLFFLSGKSNLFLEQDENLKKTTTQVRTYLENLISNQKETYLRNLIILCRADEKVKTSNTIGSLVFYRRLEGQATSKLLLSLLPEEFRENKSYKEVSLWFSRVGRMSNSFDSFLDLPEDYSEGNISIDPSLFNRLKILQGSLGDIRYITTHPNIYFFNHALALLADTIKNRMNKKFENLQKQFSWHRDYNSNV